MSVYLETQLPVERDARIAPDDPQRLLPARSTAGFAEHEARVGARPTISAQALIALVAGVRLNGRGGAAFPLARKLSGVVEQSSRRRPVVIVNASESDPTSAKDKALAVRSPHLVTDGLLIVADALGADRSLIAAHGNHWEAALSGRPDRGRVQRVAVPDRFVASEASSLVNLVQTGDARPLGRFAPIWEKGVGGAPTLVINAETAAQVALLARFGPEWFAALGQPGEPGTALVTIGGAAPNPGVREIDSRFTISELLATKGSSARGLALIGGLAGTWVRLEDVAHLTWSVGAMSAAGVSRGVGSVTVLGDRGCLLAETARLLRYLADESAGQCGPCMFGLPAVAADVEELAQGGAPALDRLMRRLPEITGRGGCAHPDGAVAMATSALRLLTGPLSTHLDSHSSARGLCGSRALRAASRRNRSVRWGPEMGQPEPGQQVVIGVDFIRCQAHGLCAHELPEAVRLDEWGYPVVDGRPLSPSLVRRAKAAANLCPVLALKLR